VTSEVNKSAITRLEFIDQTVHYLPINLAQFFPNLKSIYVHNCQLLATNSNDFQGLKHLTDIAFTKNKLTSLPDDTFDNLPQLERLDLSQNFFKQFPQNLLENAIKLKILNVSNNELEAFKVNLFSAQNQIEELYASGNKIKEISGRIFKHLKKLRVLDFKRNECINVAAPENMDMKSLMLEIMYNCM